MWEAVRLMSWVIKSSLYTFKLLGVLLLIVLAPFLSAEFSSSTQFKAYTAEPLKPGYKLFTDKQNRFSAAQPLGWNVNYHSPPLDGVIFSIQPSESGNENVAVNIMVTPPATNIIEVAKASEKYLIEQPGIEQFEIQSDQDISLSGSVGVERSVTFKLQGTTLYIRTLYLQHPSHTFALSFTTTAGNVKNMKPAFDQMIRNFTIL